MTMVEGGSENQPSARLHWLYTRRRHFFEFSLPRGEPGFG